MKSLARKRFIDEHWDAARLDDAAEFWLQLYDSAARLRRFSRWPEHSLEIRLTGFPRSEGESLAETLRQRIAGAALELPCVSLLNPDTLVLRTEEVDRETAPVAGLGLGFVSGSPFDGLAAEFRFRIRSWKRRWAFFSSDVWSTLVIVGEIRGDSVLVKSVWRSGLNNLHDKDYRLFAPPDEQRLRAGLENFCETGEVTDALAKRLHKSTETDRSYAFMGKVIQVPFEKCRLPGLLLRFAGISAGIVLVGFLIHFLVQEEWWMLLSLLLPVLALPTLVVAVFLVLEFQAWVFGHRLSRKQFDAFYETCRVVESIEGLAHVPEDAHSRKWTRELAEAVFTHLGDFAIEGAGCLYSKRIFAAADGVTLLLLSRSADCFLASPELRFEWWPPLTSWQIVTFFQEGGRVETENTAQIWYRKVDRVTLLRSENRVEDPLELFRNHVAAAESFAREQGLTPARIGKPADVVRRQESILEEERRQYLERPYLLSDHIRWYLNLPRRELRA